MPRTLIGLHEVMCKPAFKILFESSTSNFFAPDAVVLTAIHSDRPDSKLKENIGH